MFLEEQQELEEDSVETVIRGLRSERLFFEPGETSSIMKDTKSVDTHENEFPFKESLAMAVDSIDPYADFKKSMEEMVEAHGLKDWRCLEELLTCYLKVNSKSNHGYIVGAFVDLLVGLAFASSTPNNSQLNCSTSSTTHSFTSPFSCSSSSTSSNSPSLSSSFLEAEDDVDKSVNNGATSSSVPS